MSPLTERGIIDSKRPNNLVARRLNATRPASSTSAKLKGRRGLCMNHTSGDTRGQHSLKHTLRGERPGAASADRAGDVSIPSPPPSPSIMDYAVTQLTVGGHGQECVPASKDTSDISAKTAANGRRRLISQPSSGGGGYDDEDNTGDGNESDSCDSRTGIPTPKSQLACPFYKFNGTRYMDCRRFHLTRVADVKQHINRCHRRPMICPTCGIIFNFSEAYDAHIKARTCDPRPGGVDTGGITPSQSDALARRVNRSLSQASQWFSIWKILFPDSPLPSSPYISSHIDETLDIVRNYWKHHGQTLIAELPAELWPKSVVNHLDISEISSQLLEKLFSRIRSRSQLATDPIIPNRTTTSSASQALAPLPAVPKTETATPSEHSPPSDQPQISWQQQPLPLKSEPETHMKVDDSPNASDNANGRIIAALPESRCSASAAGIADAIPSQHLPQFSVDSFHMPFDQSDDIITRSTDNFYYLSYLQPNSVESMVVNTGAWFPAEYIDLEGGQTLSGTGNSWMGNIGDTMYYNLDDMNDSFGPLAEPILPSGNIN